MRKALTIAVVVTWVATLLPVPAVMATDDLDEPTGYWTNVTVAKICNIVQTGRVCAEWVDPDHGAENGVLCCIDRSDLDNNSFGDCQLQIRTPRGGETEAPSDGPVGR